MARKTKLGENVTKLLENLPEEDTFKKKMIMAHAIREMGWRVNPINYPRIKCYNFWGIMRSGRYRCFKSYQEALEEYYKVLERYFPHALEGLNNHNIDTFVWGLYFGTLGHWAGNAPEKYYQDIKQIYWKLIKQEG